METSFTYWVHILRFLHLCSKVATLLVLFTIFITAIFVGYSIFISKNYHQNSLKSIEYIKIILYDLTMTIDFVVAIEWIARVMQCKRRIVAYTFNAENHIHFWAPYIPVIAQVMRSSSCITYFLYVTPFLPLL